MTYLDIVAGSIELCGIWIVGNKCKWGYALGFLCCLIWIAFVLKTQTTFGLLLVVVPAMIINVRNFIKWSKDNKQTETTIKSLPLYPQEIGLYLVTKPTTHPVKHVETIKVLKEKSTNKLYIHSNVIQYVDSPTLKQWFWYGPITLEQSEKIDIDKSPHSDKIYQ